MVAVTVARWLVRRGQVVGDKKIPQGLRDAGKCFQGEVLGVCRQCYIQNIVLPCVISKKANCPFAPVLSKQNLNLGYIEQYGFKGKS
jgi:hypothetical protein